MSTMSTEDKTYNGWSNYPTWNVNLWLSNDEGLYNQTQDLVRAAMLSGDDEPTGYRVDVADNLKAWVIDTLVPADLGFETYADLGASFAADLLGYALDQVDWFEIADSWIEDAKED